ncbi:replication factor C large subunit [Methanosphaera sp. WGK6]|uniref:replication factor C large subunit n=1 Tax=Methanosphaera sp. WGK6 TaxID=1561964 RepID=UPI00084C451B|nr:replication factor C large subunit [Methanosphaera sp. WGK6]OED30045.1 ATPase AAA [Methanosphaera sp. WGK6]
MKWVEKYAPKSLGDVLGNAKPKAEIEVWANKWSEGTPQKPLLLVGSPGIGKTTMAHLVGKEYFSETIELNASDKRSYDVLKRSIGESSQTKSLFQSGYKLLIMDEVDGISGRDDSGGARAINETIENAKQPLIMMANDPYSKRLTTIKNKCQVIKFTKIHTNTINAQLKRICSWEDIKYDPDAIKLLSKQSNGDLRSAITSLEAIVDNTKNITMDSISVISKKDNEQNIFDTVRTVLKSKNTEHILEAMRVDTQPQFLIELLAENIPREYERTNEIAEAYEMIALADVNLGRTFKTQNYTYWKYAFLFMGRGVANAKKETYKKFVRYTNSTVYAKLAKGRKNKNLREEVTRKMSLKLHTSPKELEKQLPYYEVLFEDNERAYDLKEYFKLTDDDVKLFRSRKIPASIEKKRMKELKKLQEQEEKEIQKQKLLKEKEAIKNQETHDVKQETKNEISKNTTKTVKKQSNIKQSQNEKSIKEPVIKKEKQVMITDKKSSKSNKKSTKKKSKQTTLFDF